MPFQSGVTPPTARFRCGSPPSGRSTFMTSAPHSASTAEAAGTSIHSATSSTLTPSKMLSIDTFLFRARRWTRPEAGYGDISAYVVPDDFDSKPDVQVIRVNTDDVADESRR